MKISAMILAVALLAEMSANANSIVSPSSETVFSFGEWSKPTVAQIPSVNGPTGIVSRECQVQVNRVKASSQNRKLQILYYPAANEVWVGEPFDRYVIMGQKIWGIAQLGGALKIRASMSAEDAGNKQDVNVGSFLAQFVANPNTMFWSDGSVDTLPLEHVFGYDALHGKPHSAQFRGPGLELKNVSLTLDKATISFRGLYTGLDLSLSLNSKKEIVQAFRDSQALPVLRRSFECPADLGTWLCPSVKDLRSPSGPQAALSCGNEYTELDATGNWILLGRAKSIVLIATGDLWIGPDPCDLFAIGNKIVGVVIDHDSREVQFFVGPGVRLPLTSNTSETYVTEIRKFTEDFRTNQYHWAPDYRISIPALFAGDSRFDKNCEFSKRQISLNGDNLVIGLCSGNPQAYPEITVGPEFQVLSTRVLGLDAPEIRPPVRNSGANGGFRSVEE